jgi:hypothetical protein
VQMEGTLQLVGGPPPEPSEGATATAPAPFEGTCAAMVDSETGEMFSVTAWPLGGTP